MKRIPHKIFLLFFLFCTSRVFFAQEVKVSAVLDSSKIRIGEQVKLDLYVTYPSNQKNLKIQWPTVGDTITGKIDVISVSAIDTTFPDKTNSTKIFQHQQITVSAYDSGYFSIPGFKFIINNDTTNALYTENFLLEVHTVPTDTSETKLKDIKPPFSEKFNWRWFKAYIYGGIAFLLFIILVIIVTVYFARRKKQIILEPEKPKIPAHITALASLELIKQEQIWKEEKVKEYYSSISDAIRLYIEERFNVNALESTTDEIMLAFRSQVVDKESKEKLQQLLMLSDLVKFAKQFPIEQEHNFTLQNAFDFVNGTKREEEVAPSEFIPVNTGTGGSATQPVHAAGAEPPSNVQSTTVYEQPQNTAVSSPVFIARPEKKSSSKNVVKIVVGAVSFLLVYLLVHNYVFSSSTRKDVLQETAEELNKTCPMMVDKGVRLDNVAAVSDDVLQYNITLVDVSADQVNINLAKENVKQLVLKEVKTNPGIKPLRDIQITLEYTYKDKNGTFLFSIKITPKDYSQSA